MTARDVGRAVRSEKLDVPFGISTTINGRTRNYTMADAPACPLRDELREAALSCIADRGGTAKSVSTVTKIVRAARMSVTTLNAAVPSLEELSVRNLSVELVHRALFADAGQGRTAHWKVTAQRLLLIAARTCGNEDLVAYLTNLRGLDNHHLHSEPTQPYSDDELVVVLDWCKTQLHGFEQRRAAAWELLGLAPGAPLVDAVDAAAEYLAQHGDMTEPSACRPGGYGGGAVDASEQRTQSRSEAWWIAHLLINPASTVEPKRYGQWRASGNKREGQQWDYYDKAWAALFPTREDAQAVMMLVINENGAEDQVLRSLHVSDVERIGESVVKITGVKDRADKAVSRKGNRASNWSGGRVLERWIELSEPARNWTNSTQLWQFVPGKLSTAGTDDQVLRKPVITFPPDTASFRSERKGRSRFNVNGSEFGLSPQQMRKSWYRRLERALGPVVSGALDPTHSAKIAWAWYRSAALTEEECYALIADAHKELHDMIVAHTVVADNDSPEELEAQLLDVGVGAVVISRLLNDDLDDSGTSFCKDPTDAPNQRPGTMCQQTPFACLFCRNAIHTRTHLPVLLALSDSVHADRKRLPAEEFIDTWAGVDEALQHILARFSDASKAQAHRNLDSARQRIEDMKEVWTG